jgi:3-hydroxyacyl-[acyl-carrier-protein] dehydratase
MGRASLLDGSSFMEAANDNQPVKCPMDLQAIQSLIPHRYPFLLVDRILEYKIGESIVGLRNISCSDPVLQGHFPGDPVVPGVIIIEGLAQTSAVLGRLTDPECRSVLLTEVSSARFRRKVVPGDVLVYEVKVVKRRKPFFWFDGEAKVDGEAAAIVSFSARLA